MEIKQLMVMNIDIQMNEPFGGGLLEESFNVDYDIKKSPESSKEVSVLIKLTQQSSVKDSEFIFSIECVSYFGNYPISEISQNDIYECVKNFQSYLQTIVDAIYSKQSSKIEVRIPPFDSACFVKISDALEQTLHE